MSGETMGTRLQRLRKAAGFSQATLAKATGIPASTIKNWEQGRRSPLLDTAARIARALGVSLDDLAGDAGEEERPKRARKKKRVSPTGPFERNCQ